MERVEREMNGYLGKIGGRGFGILRACHQNTRKP